MLRNLPIGLRLAFAFGAVVALIEIVAFGATRFGQTSRDELAYVIETAGAKDALAAEMKALLLEQQSVIRSVGLRSEVRDMHADEDRAKELGMAYEAAMARMAKLELATGEARILRNLRVINSSIDEPLREALGLATGFHSEAAIRVITERIDPLVENTLAELGRLIELQKATNRSAVDETRFLGDKVALGVYAIEVIVLVLAALLSWAVTRSITAPMGAAVAIAKRVAAGDLTSRIEPDGRDEAAALLATLREMNDGLVGIVMRIRGGSETIAEGACQVAAGNQQLSARTEEHASSLEETASTLEQFTATVRSNADNARQASVLAGTVSSTAERSGDAMSRVVATMQEVSASSKLISDIVTVIDALAFQTNILALNAAVEAARAGEQGRGFAVVASEVRNLAQRSASSAKEIRTLIESSTGRVEAGARLVQQASDTMDELVGSVKRVAEIMAEIAAASHEQSSGIEQINKAVVQMDRVVQMNASLVEEVASAAASMESQAASLASAVAQFRLREDAAPALSVVDAESESQALAPRRPSVFLERRPLAPAPRATRLIPGHVDA
jgi:methyl-accepting chemotaxis protein